MLRTSWAGSGPSRTAGGGAGARRATWGWPRTSGTAEWEHSSPRRSALSLPPTGNNSLNLFVVKSCYLDSLTNWQWKSCTNILVIKELIILSILVTGYLVNKLYNPSSLSTSHRCRYLNSSQMYRQWIGGSIQLTAISIINDTEASDTFLSWEMTTKSDLSAAAQSTALHNKRTSEREPSCSWEF